MLAALACFLGQGLNHCWFLFLIRNFAQISGVRRDDPFPETLRVAEFALLGKHSQQVGQFGTCVPGLCLCGLDQAIGLLLGALVGGQPVRVIEKVEHKPLLLQHQVLLVIQKHFHGHEMARLRDSLFFLTAFTLGHLFFKLRNALLEKGLKTLLFQDFEQVCSLDVSLKLPRFGLGLADFCKGNFWETDGDWKGLLKLDRGQIHDSPASKTASMFHSKLASYFVQGAAQADIVLAQCALEQFSLVLATTRLQKVLSKQNLDGCLG